MPLSCPSPSLLLDKGGGWHGGVVVSAFSWFTCGSAPLQVTVVRNYARSRLKADWLTGRYSHVRSVAELRGRRMTPLDAETWGEILQAELDR